MPQIYVGDQSRLEADILDGLLRLPDDYWSFVGCTFDGREADVLIIREVPEGETSRPSTLIVTEVKHESRPLRGLGQDSPWYRIKETGEEEPWRAPNGRDLNPYFQAVNTANAVKAWLWNFQPVYRQATSSSEDAFKVWPDVLIISPPGVRHILPVRPSSGYGRWVFSVQEWIDHVLAWNPREGVSLTRRELEELANTLGIRKLETTQAPKSTDKPAELREEEPLAFARFLSQLIERVQTLEMRVARLERPRGPREPVESTDRELSVEERRALIESVRETATSGKSRALPTIIARMDERLGYRLKDTQYNGFGTAGALIRRAANDGLIKLGPKLGPNYTLYLPEEAVAPDNTLARDSGGAHGLSA